MKLLTKFILLRKNNQGDFRREDFKMNITNGSDLINSIISFCTIRSKSIGFMQRLLKLKYKINISKDAILQRIRDLKFNITKG